jgi:hypothetical protein
MNGTIKVGRWTYPAAKDADGRVTRNTKRDGSGEWDVVSLADRDKFVPAEEETAPEAPAEQKQTDAPEVPGFTPDASSDYEDLRVAYRHIFEQFAITYDELASHLGVEVGRAKALVSVLRDSDGLVVTDHVNDSSETVIQSLHTYDHITIEEAMANFAKAVLPEVKVRRTSNHGGKVGAQTKKPGRSSWAVGDNCPQGHLLEEGDVYQMPSGRKQCRKCRLGYPSNA